MEFPDLGQNCSHKSCNKLDFLPMKCDACHVIYCSEHYSYTRHDCPSAYQKDVQVPECPLCGAPVPGKRGEAPDVAVGAHIDNDCQDNAAKQRRNKVFTNRCSYQRCKGKEMVPLVCAECFLNFCFRHRHAADHACGGKMAAKRRMAAEAAQARLTQSTIQVQQNTNVTRNGFSDIQGNMTEDEALAHALALSMQADRNAQSQDTNIARTLQNRQRVGGEQTNARCNIS